jgi:hypothetical protein
MNTEDTKSDIIGMVTAIRSHYRHYHDIKSFCDAVIELEASRELLAASCRELVQAMRDYGMDVDTEPPHKHRRMMERAEAVLETWEDAKSKQSTVS